MSQWDQCQSYNGIKFLQMNEMYECKCILYVNKAYVMLWNLSPFVTGLSVMMGLQFVQWNLFIYSFHYIPLFQSRSEKPFGCKICQCYVYMRAYKSVV